MRIRVAGIRQLVVATAAAVILASCVTAPEAPPAYRVDDPYGDGAVVIRVTGFQRLLKRPQGIVIDIRNASPRPVTVVWDRSSISYSGYTRKVFLSGVNLSMAGTGMPARRIPAGSSISVTVYPADNVMPPDDILPMTAGETAIVLEILVDGQERRYTVSADTSWRAAAPAAK